MRKLAVILSTFALLGAGAAIAVAGGGGSTDYGNAGHDQYHEKPGCGPDKTDGVAGNSGRHDGQPPKDDDRGDCPNPPGQCDHNHFSSFYFTGGSSQNDDCGDGCDSHHYSSFTTNGSSSGGDNQDNCGNCDNNHYSSNSQGNQGKGGDSSKDDCNSSSSSSSPTDLAG